MAEEEYWNGEVDRRAPMRLHPKVEKMIEENHTNTSRLILLLEDPNVGICSRTKALELTVNGNGKQPGLAEDVRTLKDSNAKQAAYVASGVSIVMATVVAWIKAHVSK